jgi:hypothetical protein
LVFGDDFTPFSMGTTGVEYGVKIYQYSGRETPRLIKIRKVITIITKIGA